MRGDLIRQPLLQLAMQAIQQVVEPSRGQNPLEPDHKQIADQMGVNVFRAAAHALLRKAGHPPADSGFDFS